MREQVSDRVDSDFFTHDVINRSQNKISQFILLSAISTLLNVIEIKFDNSRAKYLSVSL